MTDQFQRHSLSILDGLVSSIEILQRWKDMNDGTHAPIFAAQLTGGDSNVMVSPGNSTATLLGAGGTFTGTGEDVLNYGEITISIAADVASATDGVKAQFSSDGVTDWHTTDEYTHNGGGTLKVWKIQKIGPYFRLVYTNGAQAQTDFHITVIFSFVAGVQWSHRLRDTLTGEDDAGLMKAILAMDSGDDGLTFRNISLQYPLPTNTDAIYALDIDQTRSTSDGFTGGAVIDLFNDRFTTIVNSTATNPKVVDIIFKRPFQTNIFGFGTATGNFSNVKIIGYLGQGTGEISWTILDESADATKKALLVPEIVPTTLTRLRIEFHTADAVSISSLAISKSQQRIARLQGVEPSGLLKDVGVTTDGYLSVSDTSAGLAIALGDVTGYSFVHKFGAAPDIDTADGQVSIWDGADDSQTWQQMVYQYSATAAIDSISSSNNGDTQAIEVQGLDATYALVTQTVTLTGQTRKALTTNLIRVFRLKNIGSVNLAGNVFVYPNTAIVAGVPTDATKIRAVIHAANNQTEMALYTIPLGMTGYMRSWYAGTAGASKSTNYIIRLKARPFGQVFQLKHRSSLSDVATSYIHHEYVEPEVFPAKTDIEMTAAMTEAGATGGAISAGFDIVLIAD